MKNSEMQGARQPDGEELDAPISLTPEQLESVATDLNISGGIGATIMGMMLPILRLLLR